MAQHTYTGKSPLQIPIGEKVVSIDFHGTKVTSVVLADCVTEISKNAFHNCELLESVSIPNSVTTISAYAFNQCPSLTSLVIPDSVTAIGEYAFSDCDITSITLSKNIKKIANDTFHGSMIKTIVIPDGVTSIGTSAFSGCKGLTSITIPDSVTSIGTSAFRGCTGLTAITIPDGVSIVHNNWFLECSVLKSITYKGTTYSSVSNFNSANAVSGIHMESVGNTLYADTKYIFTVLTSDGDFDFPVEIMLDEGTYWLMADCVGTATLQDYVQVNDGTTNASDITIKLVEANACIVTYAE